MIGTALPNRIAPLVLGGEVLSELGLSRLRALVVNASQGPRARVTILLFPPGSPQPTLAVKVPTTDAAGQAVERERRLLVELQQLDLGPLRPTVPRVVRAVEFQGRSALLVTAGPGTPMLSRYLRPGHTASAEAVRADFNAADAWLAALWERTATPAGAGDLDQDLADRLRLRFARHRETGEVVRRLLQLQSEIASAHRVAAVTHGDFWIGNLLMRQRGVSGVVDWEAGALRGEPILDLACFALSYALGLDRQAAAGSLVPGQRSRRAGAWGTALAHAMRGRGWFPELFRAFLRQGLSRLGAPPEQWAAAALVGLAQMAVNVEDGELGLRYLRLFRGLAAAF